MTMHPSIHNVTSAHMGPTYSQHGNAPPPLVQWDDEAVPIRLRRQLAQGRLSAAEWRIQQMMQTMEWNGDDADGGEDERHKQVHRQDQHVSASAPVAIPAVAASPEPEWSLIHLPSTREAQVPPRSASSTPASSSYHQGNAHAHISASLVTSSSSSSSPSPAIPPIAARVPQPVTAANLLLYCLVEQLLREGLEEGGAKSTDDRRYTSQNTLDEEEGEEEAALEEDGWSCNIDPTAPSPSALHSSAVSSSSSKPPIPPHRRHLARRLLSFLRSNRWYSSQKMISSLMQLSPTVAVPILLRAADARGKEMLKRIYAKQGIGQKQSVVNPLMRRVLGMLACSGVSSLSSRAIGFLSARDYTRPLLLEDGYFGARLYRALPAWQRIEIAIVEMMGLAEQIQVEKAEWNREERQKRRQRQILEQQHQQQLINDDTQPSSSIPPLSSSPSVDSYPSAPFYSLHSPTFLSHFHLLTQLLPELGCASLERLVHFLDPSPTFSASMPLNTDDTATSIPSSMGMSGSGMSLCYRLLDDATQIALIELLLHTMLHWQRKLQHAEERGVQQVEHGSSNHAEIEQPLDTNGGGETDEQKWQQYQRNDHRQGEGNHQDHSEGSSSPGEGFMSGSSSSEGQQRMTPSPTSHTVEITPAGLVQLRLLRLLRVHSGHYRVSSIVHRCIDYNNWLAAAVAMENASNDAAANQTQQHPSDLQLAGGATVNQRTVYVADAMECRFKVMEQRATTWTRWKLQRQHSSPSPPSSSLSSVRCESQGEVPMLLPQLLPPLPNDVWLSFDSYAIESGQLLMQLVLTHLINVQSVGEQARLMQIVSLEQQHMVDKGLARE